MTSTTMCSCGAALPPKTGSRAASFCVECRKQRQRDANTRAYRKRQAARPPAEPAAAKTCGAPGCARPLLAKGLCHLHYYRMKRRGELEPADHRRHPDTPADTVACSVGGCDEPGRARGLCARHYRRWQMYGDPLGRRARKRVEPWWGGEPRSFDVCSVAGCISDHMARGLCHKHLVRFHRHGDPLVQRRKEPDASHVSKDGYRVLNGGMREHRAVMAAHIGRELRAKETVHHKDGDRLNNALSNLELWSSAQPAGQRVEDKTAWALEWLALYAPERLR